MARFLSFIVALLVCLNASADTITFHSGGSISGTIMQENTATITLLYGKSTMKIARADVKSITRTPKPEAKPTTPQSPSASSSRLGTMELAVSTLAREQWATDLEEIAATVIDVGVLKNVPYKSFRCGTDFEMNVYGDPDAPAGIEIGVYGDRAKAEEARAQCIKFISKILGQSTDVKILELLDKNEDKIERNSLTFEITPPTAEDSYGGWWISIYSEDTLDKSRASDAEMKTIAQPRTVTQSTSKPPKEAPKPTPSKDVASEPTTVESDAWTEREIRKSRAPKAIPQAPSSASSGGSVYVKGYYRKDGTYVRPHSRKR